MTEHDEDVFSFSRPAGDDPRPETSRQSADDQPAIGRQSAGNEPAEDGDDDSPPTASMGMTKAELLDRLHGLESDLTKAQLLERIRALESGEADAEQETTPAGPPGPAAPTDTTTRSVTVDGVPYTWTEATEDTVPEEARLVYARARAAGGL